MIYNQNKVEILRQRYPEGTRICVDSMDDYCPIESGTCGTVEFVDDAGTLHCKFDNGRTLGVIPDVDKFHKIDQEQTQTDQQTEEITEAEDIEESEEMNISMCRSSFEKSLAVFFIAERNVVNDKIFRYLCRNRRIPIGT